MLNVQVLYASKADYTPIINTWPNLEKAYPFAKFLKTYGWDRPTVIMLSVLDKNTNLEQLIEQIKFDFSLKSDEDLMPLRIAFEAKCRLVGFATIKEFFNGKDFFDDYESAVVADPTWATWYCFSKTKEVLENAPAE